MVTDELISRRIYTESMLCKDGRIRGEVLRATKDLTDEQHNAFVEQVISLMKDPPKRYVYERHQIFGGDD